MMKKSNIKKEGYMMKKSNIVLIAVVIINIIINIFLLAKYIEFKPLLNELSKTYIINQ